jgi:hypothetical protein
MYENEIEFRGFIDMIELIQDHPGFAISIALGLVYIYMIIISMFRKDKDTPEC